MKNRMVKKWMAACMAALLAVSSWGCGAQKETTNTKLEHVTFVLDWTPNTNHTGIYAALENGYFEEVGLDVEIVQPLENGAEAMVASGQAQFGVSAQDTLAPAVSGETLPVTAVAALVQHNTSGILSRQGEGMDRPKGMEGKRYATWDVPIEQAMVKQVVEEDGGVFENVALIPSTVNDEVSALRSKQVDAIWVFYGWAGVAAEQAQLDVDYFSVRELNPVFDYYTPVLIAGNQYLEEQPEQANAFLKAAAKGYQVAMEDPEAAAECLLRAAPELDRDLVMASQKYLSAQYQAEVDQWGYIDPARWNAFYQWLNENKLVEQEIPENAGFSNDFLPAS